MTFGILKPKIEEISSDHELHSVGSSVERSGLSQIQFQQLSGIHLLKSHSQTWYGTCEGLGMRRHFALFFYIKCLNLGQANWIYCSHQPLTQFTCKRAGRRASGQAVIILVTSKWYIHFENQRRWPLKVSVSYLESSKKVDSEAAGL